MIEFSWTDENVAKLRRCADAGLSASAIAVILKCSRNAVIGKSQRIGVELHGRGSMKGVEFPSEELAAALGVDLPPDAPMSLAPPVTTPRPRAIEPAVVAPIPTPFDTLPLVETDHMPGVSIGDLRSEHCRAIVNGDPLLYCGKAIAHTRFSFCAEHAAAFLTTPAKLRNQQRSSTPARFAAE